MNVFDDLESIDNDENSDSSSILDVSQLISQSKPPDVPEQATTTTQSESVTDPISTIPSSQQPPNQQQIRLVMGESVIRWRESQKNPSEPNLDKSSSYLLVTQSKKVPSVAVPWERSQIKVSNNPQQAWLTSQTKLDTEATFLAKELQSQDESSATHIETVAVWDPARQVYVLEIPQFHATDFVSHVENDGSGEKDDTLQRNTPRSRLDPLAQQRQAELALRRKRKVNQVSTSQSPKQKKQNPPIPTTGEPPPTA
eukprot:Nitzschia sp. Nitz4//scaffold76_size158648//78244//79008//NITZ4_002548-RA/size158648-processed-gene-0.178-mRNA-1//1//CDS//3329557851//3080//frame0